MSEGESQRAMRHDREPDLAALPGGAGIALPLTVVSGIGGHAWLMGRRRGAPKTPITHTGRSIDLSSYNAAHSGR